MHDLLTPSPYHPNRPLKAIALAVATACSLAACGGSDNNVSAAPVTPPQNTAKTEGVVIGSYFRNAKVCFDTNANGRCDDNEVSARTDNNGRFSLAGAAAAVVAEIGTDAIEFEPDTNTSKPVSGKIVLLAPKEAPGIVSFHSTAVVAEMDTNLNFSDATKKVAASIGVPSNKLLADFNKESDAVVKAALKSSSDEGLLRIRSAIANKVEGEDDRKLLSNAALTARYYQTKAPYSPQQDAAGYEAPPAGYAPVYTQLVARHGSRGLSSMKYDMAVYNMWKKAQEDGALTALGAKLGPDVLKIMKANFLLGYGVPGISKPGYGNETQVGINEHKQLAARMLLRQPAFWKQIGETASTAPRKIVSVTSGVDRAVDSGTFFVESLKTAQPALAPLITYPAAPGPFPDNAPAVSQPNGTNRFLLYFHKLDKTTDLVTNTTNPLYRTYQASQEYQAFKNDQDLADKQSGLFKTPEAKAAGRAVLERLFTKAFIDKIENGSYKFSNAGSSTFSSDDGGFTSTLTGDGKTKIESLADAGSMMYELYVISPAMRAEANVDFSAYMPLDQAKQFASLNDASDFYDKGPGMTEKGDITYKMSQILVDDLFAEVDAINKGDLSHAAKLRFTHAEIIIPLASRLGLKNVFQQLPKALTYSYQNNPWRGEYVSPMAANLQWDVFKNASGNLIVKMLYNEKETDFMAACDNAKISSSSHFYDYAKLKACYGYAALN